MTRAVDSTVAADWVEHVATAMGGNLRLQVRFQRTLGDAERASAAQILSGISARILRWSDLATRHRPSQLTALNADSRAGAHIGPTLTAMLAWAAEAYELTGGLVDVGLLTQRVAAESVHEAIPVPTSDRRWTVDAEVREFSGSRLICGGTVSRPHGMMFDLDGIGKGWIVDRAVDALTRQLDSASARGALPAWSSCFVDGDGDIALRHRGGAQTVVSVQIPRAAEAEIGSLTVAGESGVATSGTGVHRWGGRHHLIDPRTGRPAPGAGRAVTVIAGTAAGAEVLAKALYLLGPEAGGDLLARHGATGVVVDEAGAAHPLPGFADYLL